MSEWKRLSAADGHELSAFVAAPEGECIGAVVLLQEIFGVNAYIRGVAERYAADGYLVVAPALFDRIRPGVELSYGGADMQLGRELAAQLTPAMAVMDAAAAFALVKESGRGVAIIGFCYGGLISWLSATRGEVDRMRPDCCVAYYPGGVGRFAAEEPRCPVLIHLGDRDSHIGLDQIDAVRAAHPEVEAFTYPGAEHGFSCDARSSFNPAADALARERTLAFLRTHIA